MLPDVADRFGELTRHIDVAVITGGRWELVVSQIIDVLAPQACKRNMHLMPTSGTCYYCWLNGEWTRVNEMSSDCGPARTSLGESERRARRNGPVARLAMG